MKDFDYLARLPGEERERDWIRTRLETLSAREGIILAAAAQADPPEDAVQAINLIQSLDEYGMVCGVGSYEQLGKYFLDNCNGVPDDALPYIDLDQIGRHYASLYPGQFLDGSYVFYPEGTVNPTYQGPGAPLPEDQRWTVKLKVSSPTVLEGVWMRLPWLTGLADYTSLEEEVTLRELRAEGWVDCTLLDAQCFLPEAGNLMEQYDDVEELIKDSLTLDNFYNWGTADVQWYAAALRLENCQELRLALDIANNPDCYHWKPISEVDVSDIARKELKDGGVLDHILESGGIDLRGYGEHLLERQGYTLTADASGYIARTSQEFHHVHTALAPEEAMAPQTTEMELM